MTSLGHILAAPGYWGTGSPKAEAQLAHPRKHKERTLSLCSEVSVYQRGPESTAVQDENW